MEDDMGAICIHQCLLKLISRAVLTHCRCNTEKKLEFLMSDPEEAFEKKRPTLQRERVFFSPSECRPVLRERVLRRCSLRWADVENMFGEALLWGGVCAHTKISPRRRKRSTLQRERFIF